MTYKRVLNLQIKEMMQKRKCPHHYHRGDTDETETLLTEQSLAGDKN